MGGAAGGWKLAFPARHSQQLIRDSKQAEIFSPSNKVPAPSRVCLSLVRDNDEKHIGAFGNSFVTTFDSLVGGALGQGGPGESRKGDGGRGSLQRLQGNSHGSGKAVKQNVLDTAICVGYRQGSYFGGGLGSRWCHGHLLHGGTEAMHRLALVYKENPQDFCFAIFMVLTLSDPKYISMLITFQLKNSSWVLHSHCLNLSYFICSSRKDLFKISLPKLALF